MRKIKSNFLSYIHTNLNDSFNNKKYQFLKLNPKISENLKKDYNENLMKKTIKELYENSPISGKFRKQKIENPEYNKKIIEIIENQSNNEEKVIYLLNKTYLDLYEEFLIYGLDDFLNEIREKENKIGETEKDTNFYINNIRRVSLNYENWFLSKNGRIRK